MTRKELLLKKYPEQAEQALAIEDPSEGTNKYLLWIAHQLKLGHDASDVSATISFFHNNPDRFKEKDINKYKDLKTLEDLIKDMGLSKRKEREKDKDGAEKIFENEDFLVVRVDDKPAMVLYGANTKWCTTMTDHSYYEDYVNNGSDFYILISKNKDSFTSSKYAIVRKSFLEFQVYDAQDSYARNFTESEEDKLRIVLQSIIMDKPPKNYLREVCQGKIPATEAAEWLNHQSKVTRTFVENKRPDLQYIFKSADELIEVFQNAWNRRNIKTLEYKKIIEIAERLSSQNGNFDLKKDIIDLLNGDDKLIFSKDIDARVRSHLVRQLPLESAKKFLEDKSTFVVKNVARVIDVDYLLKISNETKGVRKRKAFNEVIVERISQDKVKQFILNQPQEVIRTLMD